MNIKKRYLVPLAFFIVFFAIVISSNYVFAKGEGGKSENISKVSIIVTDENSNFSSKDGLWYPGRRLSKKIFIKNMSKDKISLQKIIFVMKLKNGKYRELNDEDVSYNDFLNVVDIKLMCDGNVLYQGNYRNMLKNGIDFLKKSEIKSNQKKPINITYKINELGSNDIENLENDFNIQIVYTSDKGVILNDIMNSMPKTGSIIDTEILIFMGILIVGIGLIILKSKQKTNSSKGESNHE